MEKQDLASALLKKQIHKEAWDNISRNYPLTENMMLNFSDELNREEISKNSSINWDAAMIRRLRYLIDWGVFSANATEEILTEETLEMFKDRWDWSELSGNSNLALTYELIDKYIDRWDWEKLINGSSRRFRNTRHDKKTAVLNMAFFERYQQYIPVEDLENSSLWSCIVDEEEEEIKKELVTGGVQ